MLSNRWQREAVKPILTVSPTFIFESPSVSTTRGSPSFSRYKKVPEPSFSTTKTLLSQLASQSWLIIICSGLIPSCTLSPFEALWEVLGIEILADPNMQKIMQECTQPGVLRKYMSDPVIAKKFRILQKHGLIQMHF